MKPEFAAPGTHIPATDSPVMSDSRVKKEDSCEVDLRGWGHGTGGYIFSSEKKVADFVVSLHWPLR